MRGRGGKGGGTEKYRVRRKEGENERQCTGTEKGGNEMRKEEGRRREGRARRDDAAFGFLL